MDHMGDDLPAGVAIRRLRYFAVVADELHFGRAAQRLHMAQPPLSQQIKALEQAIGVTLLTRNSRTVALTPAGHVLRRRIDGILDDIRGAIDDTVSTARGQLGTIRLGFISSVAGLVSAAIPAFTLSHPRVSVQLIEGFTDSITDGLMIGSLDAAVVRDSAPRKGMSSITLFTEEFRVLVPEAHRLASRRQLTASDLTNEALVLYPNSAGLTAWQRNLEPLSEIGETPRIVQTASNWVTIMHLVAAGTGVTLAPASVTTTLVPGVRAMKLTDTAARSRVEVLCSDSELRPAVLELREAIISTTSPGAAG